MSEQRRQPYDDELRGKERNVDVRGRNKLCNFNEMRVQG